MIDIGPQSIPTSYTQFHTPCLAFPTLCFFKMLRHKTKVRGVLPLSWYRFRPFRSLSRPMLFKALLHVLLDARLEYSTVLVPHINRSNGMEDSLTESSLQLVSIIGRCLRYNVCWPSPSSSALQAFFRLQNSTMLSTNERPLGLLPPHYFSSTVLQACPHCQYLRPGKSRVQVLRMPH